MRLDKSILMRRLAPSRSRAELLIKDGCVKVNGRQVLKPSFEVKDEDEVTVTDSIKYVGRGGLKLERALEAFSVSVDGCDCIDIGASTGGFTECLLMHNAKSVVAVDVGHGQMAERIAGDMRVTLLENTNARFLTEDTVFGKKDIAVMDVSFISQTAIYPAMFSCLKDCGKAITLIKPQFEAGSEFLNKKGIIKDKKAYLTVLNRIEFSLNAHGWYIKEICLSPIKGGDGNTEFLLLTEKGEYPNFDFRPLLKKEGLL